MAGVRNQARLAAQLRLRRQVARQDELVRAYFAAEAAVEQAERKLAAVRAQCESRLGHAESARDASARTLAAALAKIAVELGEERAAEILDVPLSRVRTARRSSPKPEQGNAPYSGESHALEGGGADCEVLFGVSVFAVGRDTTVAKVLEKFSASPRYLAVTVGRSLSAGYPVVPTAHDRVQDRRHLECFLGDGTSANHLQTKSA